MELLWPAVAALGFVALTAVIIALGTRSTARYESERNGAGGPGGQRPSPAAVPPGRGGRSWADVERRDGAAGPEPTHRAVPLQRDR